MSPRTSVSVVGLAAALAFALAGCVSLLPLAHPTQHAATPSHTPTTPAISVEPATGALITGTGYTFHGPEGWTTPPDAPVRADAYLISAEPDSKGVFDTVNVLIGPENTDTFDVEEHTAVAYLEQVVGATHVQVRPRIAIGGSPSVHISSLRAHNGINVWSEQYAVNDSGTGFTITFAFNEAESPAERDALAESVLATWNWA